MVDKQRLTTFVLGGVAGALAGILLAPKSGKELRGSITSRAGEARERGRETYFEAQERVQERLAESRERPPRGFTEARPEQEEAEDPLPTTLGPATTPEPVLGHEPPVEAPTGVPAEPPAAVPPGSPPLRDVSWDEPRPAPGEEEPDPEEIRRKIQETRLRLRARLETPPEPEEDAPADRDA